MKVLTIDQMHQLKELGVDVKPKGMCLMYTSDSSDCYYLKYGESTCEDDVVAFGLQDIIELLPVQIINCNEIYLLKIIYEIDRYLQDPTKFSKYTDQYKFIENWIKRDIGHILTIKTHIRVDMYDYVNYGVDYDLFK